MTHACPTRRSSDLRIADPVRIGHDLIQGQRLGVARQCAGEGDEDDGNTHGDLRAMGQNARVTRIPWCRPMPARGKQPGIRSEEHTSELQSLMRTSYAVFCLKKTNRNKLTHVTDIQSHHTYPN